MIPLKIDCYEQMAVQSAVRTGEIQFVALRDSIAGKKPFNAQTRLLLELVRRGRITADDLQVLASRDRKVQP